MGEKSKQLVYDEILNETTEKKSTTAPELDTDPNLTCCISGHRPKYLPWGYEEKGRVYHRVRRELKQALELSINDGYCYFITGMAMGIDIIGAEVILELQQNYPQVKLIAAIPCLGQTKSWTADYKARYQKILDACYKQIIVSPVEYSRWCMHKRNRFMVNHSTRLIAVHSPDSDGGTFHTINYAQQKGLDVIVIKT